MNHQEIFDKVAIHLLTQNKKSTLEDGTCAYRGEGGLKCAIGCLIPDSKYKKVIEGHTIITLKNFKLGLDDIINTSNYYLLQDLQKIHDKESVKEWKISLQEIADENNLDASILKSY